MTVSPTLHLGDRVSVYHGDCRDVLRQLPSNSIDAVVTDPPYGLKFMGRAWDAPDGAPFAKELWSEVLRVLKPGGHLLAFSGTRTYHRMAVAIEDAGFEIRDQFGWLYGSGFPKSMNVSKAIDKAKGAVRRVVGKERLSNDIRGGALLDAAHDGSRPGFDRDITVSATPEAEQWDGWGTAVKPAWEPLCFARKPLDGTVADNVLKHGTGAINIDGCRVPFAGDADETATKTKNRHGDFDSGPMTNEIYGEFAKPRDNYAAPGRWPANIGHDGSAEVISAFPGEAARFFYTAKADADDRIASKHPTIKPLDLMQHYVRLVTPPGGTVLDPFAGTGTTGEAAWREGFRATLIERDETSIDDIKRRLHLAENPSLRDVVVATGNAPQRPLDELPLFGGPGDEPDPAQGGGGWSTAASQRTDNRADRAPEVSDA